MLSFTETEKISLSSAVLTFAGILLYNTEDGLAQYRDCIYYLNQTDIVKYCLRSDESFVLERRGSERCSPDAQQLDFKTLKMNQIQLNDILLWSGSTIEIAENYAAYLNGDSRNDDEILCNCTKEGSFGKYCEYEFISLSTFEETLKYQFLLKEHDFNMRMYDVITEQLEDEQFANDVESSRGCPFKPDHFNCDESLFHQKYFSCGDGQFIEAEIRYNRNIKKNDYCSSFRDKNFMCEIDEINPMWTDGGQGHCLLYGSDSKYQFYHKHCIFELKCKLTNGQQHEQCDPSILQSNCDMPSSSDKLRYPVTYPSGSILTPYLQIAFPSNVVPDEQKIQYFYFVNSVKCRGFQAMLPSKLDISREQFFSFTYRLEHVLCREALRGNTNIKKNHEGPQYQMNCSHFRCGDTFQCVSEYRLRDGYNDCLNGADESPTLNCPLFVQKDRFQCSMSEQTCLLPTALGNIKSDCRLTNWDEYIEDKNIKLSNFLCRHSNSVQCETLRNYILNSSATSFLNNTVNDNTLQQQISFRQYCDTFWDLNTKNDEIQELCKKYWICSKDEFQCKAGGECISLTWVCNNVWDCSDASDEQGMFIIQHLSKHNNAIMNLTEMKQRCYSIYREQPFSQATATLTAEKQVLIQYNERCNITTEYPCIRPHTVAQFAYYQLLFYNFTNLKIYPRPCIRLEQIGDGIPDCYGGIDERNTQTGCLSNEMLGFDFKCEHTEQQQCIPYKERCNERCLNNEDKLLCDTLSCILLCPSLRSYQDEKCSRIIEPTDYFTRNSLHYCNTDDVLGILPYRSNAKLQKPFPTICLPTIPPLSINDQQPDQSCLTTGIYQTKQSNYKKSFNNQLVNNIQDYFRNQTFTSIKDLTIAQRIEYQEYVMNNAWEGWICMRGIAVVVDNHNEADTVCLCPPAFYGKFCNHFSDRITVIISLEKIPLDVTMMKVLSTFLLDEDIIDTEEFHVQPTVDENRKHRFYFVYPRPRILNGSYSVRFEAFQLHVNLSINLLVVWHYSIQPFVFLPSYRLAKVLKFQQQHICKKTNPCKHNSKCYPIMNNLDEYFCHCQNNSSGKNCEILDSSCDTTNYCSSKAVCRPRLSLKPLCICPLHHFGPRCYLTNSLLTKPNMCSNNGTMHVSYDPRSTHMYKCTCDKNYYGDNCQYASGSIHLVYNISYSVQQALSLSFGAAVIQLYDFHPSSLNFIIKYQIVLNNIPKCSQISNGEALVPTIGLLKLHYKDPKDPHPKYFLLYIQMNKYQLNVTVELSLDNYCPRADVLHSHNKSHIEQYFFKGLSADSSGNANSSSLSTVYEYHELCSKHKPLLCFHDDNYFCVCDTFNKAECFGYNHQIDRCQHCLSQGRCIQGNSNDPSNFICLCQKCYYGSICQSNIQLLSFSVESLLSKDLFSPSLLVQKLSISIYITITLIISYWLMAFVTIERMYIALHTNEQWLKSPKIAKRIVLLIIIGTLASHAHEFIYYDIVQDSKYTQHGTWCVTKYNPILSVYNQINTFIQYLVPFFINFILTVILISLIAHKRAAIADNNKALTTVYREQFQKRKDLFIPPIIILFCALPQFLISFSLACTELNIAWQRYLLTAAYFCSYLPQVLGYYLYIVPSTFYREEFSATIFGKILKEKNKRTQLEQLERTNRTTRLETIKN
ncbi:unnamed protein product [Didymodactylos carnosus]|uniref:EGF-like domain-containing protein n=1 Tax=Didymodactylos carnosus TaxID=1234261 RepID=A0A814DS77_9BILA|nr:unnamed protein product [Didymodactylos carnosus]CAF3734283.1 unnamed protein product [Didymodactylos carnosus]